MPPISEESLDDLLSRLRGENEVHRREDRYHESVLEDTAFLNRTNRGIPRVKDVDLLPKWNALNHNCEKYELIERGKGKTAIIRRAGVLRLEVELDTEANLKKLQQLRIYFNFGTRPAISKGTQGILELTGKKEFDQGHEEWDHRVVSEEGKKAVIEINVPNDAPVGIWRLIFEISPKNSTDRSERHVYRDDHILYILFNPWSKDDEVYMPEEEKREEYVLNDVGKIWRGAYPTAKGRTWVFGQFDDAVLPASILLMERSGLNPDQRGDPVLVARAISKMVNFDDDNGLLVGDWSGDYQGGTPPSKWTGSIKIMEQYLRTSRPVKYGQCWVFSGCTTTVCRSLGIPCRSVTNLNSAHDTNSSLTIDKYLDEKGGEFEADADDILLGPDDSIWNFHVWNDVWMARPDLPSGYGGWQAIDATPQESSDGIYQCGPASLVAIRNGQTELKYDVNFVLAEVNADVVRWQRDDREKDGFRKLTSDKTHVGREVLTKKPGKIEPEAFTEKDKDNVTGEYKHVEGSKAERVTLHTAVRKTRAARHAFRFPSFAEQDVEFELEDVERVPIGQDFAITIKATNTSTSERKVFLVLSAFSEYYTGIKAHPIKRAEGLFKVNAGANQTLSLKVKYSEYYDKLVEYGLIKLTAMAHVHETTQTWMSEDDFQVIKPILKIDAPEKAQINKPFSVKISFTNPLDKPLKKCILVIDGPGLTRPKTIPVKEVPPAAIMKHTIYILPTRKGEKTFVATFNSKDLIDLTGSTSIVVAEK